MEYNGEGVHALVCAVEDLESSNLIFIDRKLKPLLKCLAYYPEFRSVFAYCAQSFDYETEKRKAMAKLGDSDIFRLPKNPKTLVPLVGNMLVEFDAGSMDLVSFAATYYPQETKQASFEQFCHKVIEPFKLALVSLVVEGIDEEPKSVERTVEFASSGLQQQTEYLLVNIYNAVQEAEITLDDRADYMVMLEGFAAALDTRDSLMIKAIWLGLKKALIAQRLCKKEVEQINEVLRMYLVTK